MSARKLYFKDDAEAVAEINRLRAGNTAHGGWTFEQACWHCWSPLQQPLQPPASMESSPQQKQFRAFLDNAVQNGWPPQRLEASPQMTPPAKVGPEAIDDLIAALRMAAAYKQPYVGTPFFGPVETPAFQRFILNHLAHHLGFFTPTGS